MSELNLADLYGKYCFPKMSVSLLKKIYFEYQSVPVQQTNHRNYFEALLLEFEGRKPCGLNHKTSPISREPNQLV